MLHRLEIENFYSIREAQVIDLCAAGMRLTILTDWRRCGWEQQKERQKVVALFGPNASGKSNVLRALSFLAWFLRYSFTVLQPDARLPFERFNDAESQRAPMRLTLHTTGLEDIERADDPKAPMCRYAYEVIIGGVDAHAVLSETLHYWPSGGPRKRLFGRNASGKVTAARDFGLSGYRPALEKILRPNVSAIATLAQLKHPRSTRIWNTSNLLTSNILVRKLEDSERDVIRYYATNPQIIQRFNHDVERVDFGIRGMDVFESPNGLDVRFRHEGLEHFMPLHYESHGTLQFMKIYPLLIQALDRGGIAVIDELDAAIHSLLLPEIVRWFHDPERNPHNAQLWMSCHSASLLEDLIKEEIWFCEKDSGGRTSVYGLRDIQAVRRTDNYYKKYLGGVYGAVPRIG